jgi:hypothetical protein
LSYVKSNFELIEEIRYGKNRLKALRSECVNGNFEGIELLEGNLDIEEFDELTILHAGEAHGNDP